MRWSTHALIGAAVGSVLGSASGSDIVKFMVIGSLFGVLPDIDIVLSGLSRDAHRSPATHSIFGAIMLTVVWVVFYLGAQAIGGPESTIGVPLIVSSATVFLSAFLHAVADTISVSGCRALYPLSSRRFRGPVRYDDWAANAALSMIAAGVVLVSLASDLSGLMSL